MSEKNNFLRKIERCARKRNIDTILLFSHKRHDGDAKGSALALKEYFSAKGYKTSYIIKNEDLCLNDIFGKQEICSYNIDERFIAVIVDCSNETVMEDDLYKKAEVSFKIDHHLYSKKFTDYNFVVEEATSTCEIIAGLIPEEMITPTMATFLYSGIFTDTQGFKYNCTADCFLKVSMLISKGASVSINTKFEKKSSNRKRAEGIISHYHESYGNNVIGSVIKKKFYNAKAIVGGVNTLLELEGKVFFCACSDRDGEIWVQLRSSHKTSVDVAKIANKYGGGGHFHAAGCNFKDWNVLEKIIEELKKSAA